jgi:hypothetical protein
MAAIGALAALAADYSIEVERELPDHRTRCHTDGVEQPSWRPSGV